MSVQDFFVEIGTEELPPKALKTLATAFSDNIVEELSKQNLSHGEVSWYAAPRRLAVRVNQLALQQQDNLRGIGPSLPFALGRKYPSAYRQAGWMFLFPSTSLCAHPLTGVLCRHHLHDSAVRKALQPAVVASGMRKKVNCHTFRHSFATHLLERGCDLRIVGVAFYVDVEVVLPGAHACRPRLEA